MRLSLRTRRQASGQLLAMVALVLAMTIWGVSYAVSKAVLQEIPPITLTFLRFTVAVAVMAPFVLRERRRVGGIPRAKMGTVVLMGLTGVTLQYTAYNLGVATTSTINAALFQGTIPAVTLIASAWFLRESVGRWNVLGGCLSVAGAAVLILGGAVDGRSTSSLFGDLMMISTVISWTMYTLLGKTVVGYQSGMMCTALSNFFGVALLTPFAVNEIVHTAPALTYSFEVWLVVVYLGVVATAGALFLWNFSLSHLSAGQAGAFVNLEPVVAVATAVMFLGETLLTGQLIGGALVIVGVLLTNGRRNWAGGKKIDRPA